MNKAGISQFLIIKNYPESKLFNNIKTLKVLLNFLAIIKIKYFKKKVNIAIIKAQTDNK